ncbi:MAG: hypothetical protein Q4C91_14285 [Eubacteriales bacterium]|nr:hypothetical protein [Eubacteriales bacterium]
MQISKAGADLKLLPNVRAGYFTGANTLQYNFVLILIAPNSILYFGFQ